MKNFKTFYEEQQQLIEKLITFGGKAYPSSGHVVIMAGGAASGKGTVVKSLLGIEGKIFDVDELKSLITRTPKLIQKVKNELGYDLSKYNTKKNPKALKDPKVVAQLHQIVGNELNLPDKRMQAFFTGVMANPSTEKPNVIFDVTLKNLNKLEEISLFAEKLGYDKKNIHIVWVVQKMEVAVQANLDRDRVVAKDIQFATHLGASQTMLQIIGMGKKLNRYMDGDIVFVFTQFDILNTGNDELNDIKFVNSPRGGKSVRTKDIDGNAIPSPYFYIKRSGKPVMKKDEIDKDILNKIASYVPKAGEWS